MDDKLIKHRVLKPENKAYRAIEMTEDEILERRIDMRRILKDTSFNTCTNRELDNMTVAIVQGGFLVEDVLGREFFYAKSGIAQKDADFRRVRSMMPFEFLNLTGSDFGWDKYQADVTKSKDIVNKYILRFPAFREKGMGLYILSLIHI